MSDNALVQYMGFEAKALVREYTFQVLGGGESQEFTLTITNEAFNSHRVRYQDAPDICSLKLRGELATYANHPPNTHYRITDAELLQYRESHVRKTSPSLYGRKPVQEF